MDDNENDDHDDHEDDEDEIDNERDELSHKRWEKPMFLVHNQ